LDRKLNFIKPFQRPLLGSLLQKRSEGVILAVAAAAQVGLTAAHLPGWACPFKAAFGIPCPGCGLSTACVELLRGNWREALSIHLFAPLALSALTLIVITCLLPGNTRQKIASRVSAIEERTGLTALLLAGLILYWGFRLFQVS